MNDKFVEQIRAMNEMYKLPINSTPTLQGDVADRLRKFKKTLSDEVDELDAVIEQSEWLGFGMPPEAVVVSLADLLGDIIVYCRSEALKYGIPLEQVLDIIMDSNMSKLGADGKPIYDENGKFLKGPNYWKPEPKIGELISQLSV